MKNKRSAKPQGRAPIKCLYERTRKVTSESIGLPCGKSSGGTRDVGLSQLRQADILKKTISLKLRTEEFTEELLEPGGYKNFSSGEEERKPALGL